MAAGTRRDGVLRMVLSTDAVKTLVLLATLALLVYTHVRVNRALITFETATQRLAAEYPDLGIPPKLPLSDELTDDEALVFMPQRERMLLKEQRQQQQTELEQQRQQRALPVTKAPKDALQLNQQQGANAKAKAKDGGVDGAEAAMALSKLAHTAIAGRNWESDDICLHSHKYLPSCPGAGKLPLLVTGVGRSGTHHIASALRMKGVDVCHEATCSDGSISWTYAVVDPNSFYPWEAAKHRINGQRFARIFHVVRHPLRCIASLTTFENMSWRFIAKHTPQVPGLAKIEPKLRRALIHWVTWNRMVEVYADQRFRMEDTMPADICRAAAFDEKVCSKRINRAARAKRPHDTVTWDDLFAVDREFTLAALRLAHKYGYEDARHVLTNDDDDDADDGIAVA